MLTMNMLAARMMMFIEQNHVVIVKNGVKYTPAGYLVK